MDRYRSIDQEITDIESHIKLLSRIRPINLVSERRKFFEHTSHSPIFRYKPFPFQSVVLKKNLHAIKTDRTPLGMIFQHKIDELMLKLSLIEAIGDAKLFTSLSEDLYGKITSSILTKARNRRKFHSMPLPTSLQIYDAEEAKKILQQVFQKYGLKRWRVAIKQSLVTDCTAGKRNTLFLRKAARFSRFKIERLIAHEIETHIFTAENGKLQPYKIFNMGLAQYLETQEGLAIFAQEQKREVPITIHGWSAISVLATAAACSGSFSDVYHKLINEGLPPKKAFRLTARIKRGLCDTSEAGAFTKELIYFSGAEKISNFAHGASDITKLFIGKVAVKDLPFISKIPHLEPPKYLPEWVKERRLRR
ncbi:MAG: tyrosine/phenylalanine carboxypeptidase domain-containing protein [Patescibacteria group bacterium]